MALVRRLQSGRRWTRGLAIPGLLPFLLVVATLLLRPLAAASPPDPTWIEGIYDDGDFDDIVTRIGLLSSACDSSGAPVLAPCSHVAPLPLPRLHPVACESRVTLQDRAPPLV